MLKLSVKERDGIKLTLPDGTEIKIRCMTSNYAPNKIDFHIHAPKSVHIDKMFYNGKTYKEAKLEEENRKLSHANKKAQG